MMSILIEIEYIQQQTGKGVIDEKTESSIND
jgi:hypothetical protein